MLITEFNTAPRDDVVAVLRPCLDIQRWIDEIVDGRPYASDEELLGRAQAAAEDFGDDEVALALSHHPRIGDRVAGDTPEAQMSRAEQGDVDAVHEDTARALREGNHAYEERFDRVFLIRAAGRSSEEVLSALRSRLDNTPDVEARIVAEQLREIALLRLRGTVTS